jgi:hypothetical protein
MKRKHNDVTADEIRSALDPQEFRVTVPARALERVLAFLENDEELEERVDDNRELRTAVDSVSDCLSAFAEANPKFDEEQPHD